ncbi:hypothetical protein BJV78DRAFT_1233486 [Lactifluus subvellereus]|nr:hypothetical protein BJV78DRAFT_1233486 [Lactifluus subvellereus]
MNSGVYFEQGEETEETGIWADGLLQRTTPTSLSPRSSARAMSSCLYLPPLSLYASCFVLTAMTASFLEMYSQLSVRPVHAAASQSSRALRSETVNAPSDVELDDQKECLDGVLLRPIEETLGVVWIYLAHEGNLHAVLKASRALFVVGVS